MTRDELKNIIQEVIQESKSINKNDLIFESYCSWVNQLKTGVVEESLYEEGLIDNVKNLITKVADSTKVNIATLAESLKDKSIISFLSNISDTVISAIHDMSKKYNSIVKKIKNELEKQFPTFTQAGKDLDKFIHSNWHKICDVIDSILEKITGKKGRSLFVIVTLLLIAAGSFFHSHIHAAMEGFLAVTLPKLFLKGIKAGVTFVEAFAHEYESIKDFIQGIIIIGAIPTEHLKTPVAVIRLIMFIAGASIGTKAFNKIKQSFTNRIEKVKKSEKLDPEYYDSVIYNGE